MKNLIPLNFFLILLFNLVACTSADTDIQDYYYPVASLKTPLVYEYSPIKGDSLGSEYWYFRTVDTDSALYLTGNYYDRFLNVSQFFREEVVSNGSIVQDYFLYVFDTSGTQQRIPAEITYGNVFPFSVQDSNTVLLQKMKWTFSEDPLITTTLTRNRRYGGKTKYTYKGKEYDAIQFFTTELVDNFQNGHLEKEYKGLEIYAKGLGYVYYKKEIDQGLILEYELVDTYPMSRLEEKFRTTLHEE